METTKAIIIGACIIAASIFGSSVYNKTYEDTTVRNVVKAMYAEGYDYADIAAKAVRDNNMVMAEIAFKLDAKK